MIARVPLPTMLRSLMVAALVLAAPALARAQHEHGAMATTSGRPPLYNLGTWSHKVTTSSPLAQKYFDQGLKFGYGFNHAEAARAFRAAAAIDPNCAMAWWGVALVAGPHINWPMMDSTQVKNAMEGITKAKALASKASAAERDYIETLATRYTAEVRSDRSSLDSAYANAMRGLAKRHPDDADAQVLFAESMMDLAPWNQWTHDGQPTPGTNEIVMTLESALDRWPDHPGANHLYIHAVEASPHPEKALPAAGRLENLEPDAGHLVHMPAHIYARVKRYDDARRVNVSAVGVDEKYIREQKPEGLYPMMYYNHNVHFIWFAATMQGRSAEALAAAKKLAGNIPPEMARQMSMIEFWPAVWYFSLARFGHWDDILKEPAPPKDLRFETWAWNYAQGMAQAAKGDFKAADRSLDSVRVIGAQIPADAVISINAAPMITRLGYHALAGSIAMKQKDTNEALAEFRIAVATEDSLHYDEPPTWYYPVRQSLGAALMNAGHPAEAEKVYREDQDRHPGNGWSLFGLAQALRAEGKTQQADAVDALFKKAWATADVTLTASVF